MELTKKEIEAIDLKMANPEKTVVCPRCGEELQYRNVNTASIVECPTEGCIHGSVRGL